MVYVLRPDNDSWHGSPAVWREALCKRGTQLSQPAGKEELRSSDITAGPVFSLTFSGESCFPSLDYLGILFVK